MSNVEPYYGASVSPWSSPGGGRLARQATRELAQIEARTHVGIARIESAAELQATKVSAVAFVGRRAMQEVAILSSAEQQLATSVPHASGRLAAIADMTALAMTEVVVNSANRIGRCS